MTLIKNNVNIDGNVDMQNNNITNANIISATSIYSISSYTHYQDIIVSELSGFRVTGNIEITGNVIAQGNITANNLLIGNWNSVYTTVNGTSANWDSVYNQVCSLSSNWSPDYISGQLTPIYDLRYASITSIVDLTEVSQASGNWNSVFDQVCSLSATWGDVYISGVLTPIYDLRYLSITSTVQADLGEIPTLSGNWNSVYNQVCSLSSTWGDVYISGVLTPVYDLRYLSITSTTQADLGEIPSLSSNWNSSFYQMTALSGNWDSVYNLTNESSAKWDSVYTYSNTISGVNGEPNGFPNRTDSVLSYNTSTKILSISAAGSSYDIWLEGKKHTFTNPFTAQALSGANFVYLTGDEIIHSQTAWGIFNDAQICYFYYDPYNERSFAIEERHGLIMDRMTHYNLHMTEGCKWVNGLAIGDYVPNTSTAVAVQYSIGSGVIADEDIISNNSGVADAGPYTLMYRQGSTGFWSICTDTRLPFLTAGANHIAVNNYSGTSWNVSPLSATNQWVNYYVFATTSFTPNYSIIIMPGQAWYSSLALAQAETLYNLNLGTLPFQEIVAVAKVTSRHGTTGYIQAAGYSRIEAVDRLLGTKLTVTGGAAPSNHNSLTGRSDANSHTAAAISTDTTSFGNIISTSATDVQTALDDINSHSHSQITGLVSLSGNWESTYTTVSSNSANWNVAYTAASGSSFGSADNIAVTWTPTYYTITTNDVSGNFKGIDNALGGVTFNGTTIVTSVTSSGKWLTMSINGSAYALPLYLYS